MEELRKKEKREVSSYSPAMELKETITCTEDWEFWLNPQGEFLYCSPACERITGYKAIQFLSDASLFLRIIDCDDRPKVIETLSKGAETGIREIEFRIADRSGDQKRIALSFRPVYNHQGDYSGIRGSGRDNSCSPKSRQELSQVRSRDLIRILADDIAHDLNGILRSLLSNIALAKLCLTYKEDQKTLDRLLRAEESCKMAKELSSRLIAFSRLTPSPRKAVSISRLIRKSAEYAFRNLKLNYSFELPEDLWLLELDERQILNMFYHLFRNSFLYIGDSGEINIRAENISLSEEDSLGVKYNHVMISVLAKSSVTSSEELLNLPPHSAVEVTRDEGTSVGLSVCHAVVNEHFGNVVLHPVPGLGTTIRIYLPAEPLEISPESPEHCFSQGKILLISNNEEYTEAAGLVFYYLGYEPIVARDSGGAIKALKDADAAGSPFSDILLDADASACVGVSIPGLLQLYPRLNVFMASNHENSAAAMEFKKIGVTGILKKPLDFEELRAGLVRCRG